MSSPGHHPRRLHGLLAVLLAGCAVGPDYHPPMLDLPAQHRRAGTDQTAFTEAPEEGIGRLAFWELLDDPQLLEYLEEALENNFDVTIAATRVLQAAAQSRATSSQFWPTVQAGGSWTAARSSERGLVDLPPGIDPGGNFTDAFLAMPAYEVDLWGRIRRADEAALARLLATEDAARTVRLTIVAQVATSYFRLLELDEELAISLHTLEGRERSLNLATVREAGGVASLQDVRQSEVLVSAAEAALIDTRRRIEQEENALSVLLGRNPAAIRRIASLDDQHLPDRALAGLPSSLLAERPDILSAERELIAANADVGQAEAAFYPQVTLTGTAGFQSVALSDLFTSPARVWQFGPSVTLPLFTGGRLTAELEGAEARFDEAVATYRKTIQSAFREVSDALISYQRIAELVDRLEANVNAYRDSARLAGLRYEGGVTSYLEVLFTEQDLFDAEIALAQARRDRLLSLVELYRALGGGWESHADRESADDSDTP